MYAALVFLHSFIDDYMLLCWNQMMTMHNSQERTIGQFIDLVDGTGWKLELVRPGIDSTLSCLLFGHISQ